MIHFLKKHFPFTSHFFSTAKNAKKQKGIAIIMAIFCVTMIMYIVTEVSYESNIEYLIHAQAIQKVKAYYAAKSGVEVSLLRIKIYTKLKKQFGNNNGGNANPLASQMNSMLNLVWSFPLSWPPILPDEVNSVEKENVGDKVKLSLLDSNYTTTISDEGAKIDINDLASPSKSIRETTRKQLLSIFQNKIENDRDWANQHPDFNAEKLVNSMTDWVDADMESLNGGTEKDPYKNLPSNIGNFPPNRAFRTLDEVRLVAGMDPDYFKLLENRITVYGAKGINVNTANSDVLTSLDKSITSEIATEVIKRRSSPNEGGQFTSAQDFWGFVESKGARPDEENKKNLPLIFDSVINFRIRSTGSSGTAVREIEAIVYDLDQTASAVAKKYADENKSNSGSGSGTSGAGTGSTGQSGSSASGGPASGTSATNSSQNSSKGPPRIVYWHEK